MLHLDAGTILIREGDQPTSAFLIEDGRLEVYIDSPNGDRSLAILGPGEIVGEMALVDQAPRSASVRAIEACLLLPITAEYLNKRLAAADPVLRLILGTILDRFRTTLKGLGGRPHGKAVTATADQAIRTAATTELRIEKELEVALREGQILVYYQPIVRLATGCLSGFEALARWHHPAHGIVPPSVFVPVAEASGLSGELSAVCLRQVARDLAALDARAADRTSQIEKLRVSINIAGYDLMIPDFIRDLGAIVTSAGQEVSRITLELTETALVHSPSEAAKALDFARQLGFVVAVDDFGTGYSTLNYVRTLPVDMLKIDGGFIQGMAACSTTHSIVASMLQLAASLNLLVVGEGIESEAERGMLQMLGCELGQGYLFGRPQPLEQTLALVSRWRTPAAPAPIFATVA